MTYSSFFYGSYLSTNTNIFIWDLNYYMPVVYYYVIMACNVISFVLVAGNMARSYKKTFIETETGLFKNNYSNSVFGGWDSAVNRNNRAVNMHRHILTNHFKEVLDRYDDDDSGSKRNIAGRIAVKSLKIVSAAVANILIVFLIVVATYLVWIIFDKRGDDYMYYVREQYRRSRLIGPAL